MSLFPLLVSPPNNTAVLLATDVRVKELIGGGLSPVTVGVIHSPNNKATINNTYTQEEEIYQIKGGQCLSRSRSRCVCVYIIIMYNHV